MRYLASSFHASVLLSAIEEVARTACDDPALGEKVLSAASGHLEAREEGKSDPNASPEAAITEHMMTWAEAASARDSHKANELSDKVDALTKDHPFDFATVKNALYDSSKKHKFDEALKNYHPAKPNDPSFGKVTAQIAEDAKVAVIGDWGTGTEDAEVLFQVMMEHKPDVVLHLGDIYQTGNPWECTNHFVVPIQNACMAAGVPQPPILTIPGNHEYFSLGVGYFQLIKTLNAASGADWAQEASFFCLRSKHNKWQFLGSDTGLQSIEDSSTPGLQDAEADWHRARIAEFPGKTIFMSHHQVVSADQGIYHHRPKGTHYTYRYFNPNLVDAFDQKIDNTSDTYLDRITLWLWGHDHYFIPYVPGLSIPKDPNLPVGDSGQPTLPLGQLLGGSAREVKGRAIKEASYVQKDDNGQMILPGKTYDNLSNHTYAILDLSSGQLNYYQVPAWYGSRQDPLKGLEHLLQTPLMTSTL